MSNQGLSASISDALSKLTGLLELDLSKNSYSGSVPDLSALTKLTYLFKSLPSSIGNVISLQELDVGDNNFSEVFPPWILGLKGLTFLRTFGSGYNGPTPDFTLLPKLVNLHFSDFTGSLPESIGALTGLTILSIGNCNYANTAIPSSITSLIHMKELHLFDCQFTGPIPSLMGNMTSMTILHLQNNHLTGSIPQGLGIDTSLTKIRLDNNLLTGDAPDTLANLNKVTAFNVSSNCLPGKFPANLLSKITGATAQGGPNTSSETLSPPISTSSDPSLASSSSSASVSGASASASQLPISPIIGGVVGVLLVAVLAVLGYLYFARKKRNAEKKSQENLKIIAEKNVEEGRNIPGIFEEPFLVSKGKLDTNINPPTIASASPLPTPTPVYIQNPPTSTAINSAVSPIIYNNVSNHPPIVYNINSPAAHHNTSVLYMRNPSGQDDKRSSLFMSQPPLAQSTSTLLAKQYHVDDQKRQSVLDKIDMVAGSGGNQIEAVLVSQWGNYVQWSNEQVLIWARELSFGEEFVECLKAHQVDGTILNTIDRETIRTDFGITDIRLRAGVLASLDRLRALQNSSTVVASSAYNVVESLQLQPTPGNVVGNAIYIK
ncbi:hypothetical protein HDU76_001735 [Blyttiomyces sp. JEL0837]|nr:hypothetical protein HDU76_001735 [Blyttiomyces sp. JEL0837]